MSKKPKLFIILLRVTIGWLFFYQGFRAIMNPSWSVLPFIQKAQSFSGFYTSIVGSASLLLSVSYITKGLFILIGAFLMLGLFVRTVSILGIGLMFFFYFPLLHFPYVRDIYYIVDEHIIYIVLLMYLFAIRAGEYFGLGTLFRFSRY